MRGQGKSFVSPEVMIGARLTEAADRADPSHWEGDPILGLRRSAIGTLVERSTRFTILLHLPPDEARETERAQKRRAVMGHGAEAIRDAIATAITTLSAQLRRSLTWE